MERSKKQKRERISLRKLWHQKHGTPVNLDRSILATALEHWDIDAQIRHTQLMMKMQFALWRAAR
jgi:hypothetical protein